MPPARIAALAREPRLALPASPPARKGASAYGSGAAGFGLGAWGLSPGSTGTATTPMTAVGVAATWACVNRLAQDIGKLSRRVMRRLPRGGARPDLDHPLNALLRDPNPWQNPSQFWAYVTAWYALRGNAYVVVIRGDSGEPRMLVPLSPDRCQPMIAPKGDLYYQVSHPTFREGASVMMHRDNVMHVRTAVSFDGYTGVSPISAGPDVFGLGLAAQSHAAVLFRQGTRLSGVIRHPGKLNPEGKAYLSEQWSARHAGSQNAFQTAVLDEGMEFQETSMTSEDAQLLQSRQFSVVEVCRMFGVPPHKVYDLSRAHFANMEQGNLEYWSDTLFPIAKQMQEECGRTLLFSDEQPSLTVDIDYDELLRTDRASRYATDEIGIRSGRLTQNEARISDGREPNVPNGDAFQVPLNMTTTGAAGAAGAAGSAGNAVPPLAAAPAGGQEGADA